MKKFNRFMAVAMSAAMLVTQGVTAFASSGADPFNGGTADGTASLLAHSVESVVVPTTLKIALNPNGYAINLRYVKVAKDSTATYAPTTKYYTLTDGKYVRSTTIKDQDTLDTALAAGDIYTVDTTDGGDQSKNNIVSLNYGIVNKSTRDKVVRVKLSVTQNTSETNNKQAIEFKDTAEEAQTYDSDTGKGAAQDELAMYLAVASADASSADPTANTHKKTTDAALNNSKTYYTKEGSTFTKVDSPDADDLATYYEDTTTIGTEILASELSDITMTVATGGVVGFKAGSENKANAEIGYKLGKAEYSLKDDADLDFGSTQQDMGDLLEMSAIGGVAGFTITGTMNTDADWTTADTVALKFVPTYHVKNATNDEVYVDAANKKNPLNQIKLVADPTVTETSVSGTNNVIHYTVPDGVSVEKVELVYNEGTETLELTKDTHYTVDTDAKTITITANVLTSNVHEDNRIKVYFDDSASTVKSLSIVAGS